MTETVATQLKAIAFDRDIQRLTENFTGREWVFKEIDRWLQQENERFFILTGEPGVGKSAIAAHLTQTRKDIAAYHFCIARQISTVEPNNVLLSLAAQLIKYFPDYGEALVNTVKPLFLQVRVEINIENINDSVVQGVVINNLHIHYPKQALDIVLRQALAALPNPPKEPVSILIDSLDEAVTYSNENNLVTLLSSVDDLPSWVRFILTSRPDKQRVLSYFETLKPYYYHLNELSEKNKKDIHNYVDGRVVSEPIQEQIQRFQVQSEALINQITELSQGNFLYTKVLLDDIELGGQPLDNLAALPKSLNDLYHNFLLRLKAEWEGKYQPIFGILTVTKAPVTEEELANLLRKKLDETELGQRLRVVQQFLDVVQNDRAENTYTLFHQSLQDYLTDKEKSEVFHCSPKAGHRQIIDYCWRYHPRDWQECDRYGLRYLASHLVDMAALEKPPIEAREYIERLHELLATEVNGRNAWFDAKDRMGETAGFLSDVKLAWSQADEAYNREPGKSIGLQCRYALMTASLNSLFVEIPIALLIALVEENLWTVSKGVTYACQRIDPNERLEVLTKLIFKLEGSLKKEALKVALDTITLVKSQLVRSQVLTQLAPYLTESLLEQAIEIAQTIQDNQTRVNVLLKLILYLPELTENSFSLIQNIQPKWCRIQALEKLIPDLPDFLKERALAVVLMMQHDWEQGWALGRLIPHLPDSLKERALTVVLIMQDELEQAKALVNLIPHLPESLKVQALESVLTVVQPDLTLVKNLQNNHHDWAKTFINLLAFLPLSHREPVVQEVFNLAQTIQSEHFEGEMLLSEIFNDNLASYISESHLQKLLTITQDIGNEWYRMRILTKFAPHFSTDIKQEILTAVQPMPEDIREEVLVGLAPHLPDSLKKQALSIAESIKDKLLQAKALIALIPYLQAALKEQALQQAVDAVMLITGWKKLEQKKLLENLAPHLSELLQKRILEIVQAPNMEELVWNVLTTLPPYLSVPLQDQALNIAQTIQYDDSALKQVLVSLIPHLTEPGQQKALDIAQTMQIWGTAGIRAKWDTMQSFVNILAIMQTLWF
ncbi:NACHT domain-containing protein [Nostoc sp.]|uniref:NACHT domain-containing protein n=1 Tax=Nostoc sp. TaxID=1180 RepID=UPI002FF4B9E7